MMMTRIVRSAGLAVTLAVALACGGGSDQKADTQAAAAAPTGKGKKFTIAMIAKSSTNPVFLAARTGAEAAAKEASEKTGLDVQIAWLTPPDEDGQVQAQRIQQAVNDGADAILVSCSDAGKMRRPIAFVATKAESILVPAPLTAVTKASLGMGGGLYPVPMLSMIAMTILGMIYLTRTTMGRRIFAFGGNLEASRFAGLSLPRIQTGVFAVSGLTAGLAAFLGAGFYGSVSSGDAQGYELYVIASAVVGGASLLGGKGSALGAMLGALLIVLIRQSIRTLHFDQNYEWIVIGCAIIIAVVVDQWSTRLTARRLSQAAESVKAAA